MWQRFTEATRRAIIASELEAGNLGSRQVDAEHLLLGIILETEGNASRILNDLGLTPDMVREEIAAAAPTERHANANLKLSPTAKRVLELAADEVRRRPNYYIVSDPPIPAPNSAGSTNKPNHDIGNEHILLGLLRLKESQAAKILQNRGLELQQIRIRIAEQLNSQNMSLGSANDDMGERRVGRMAALRALFQSLGTKNGKSSL